MRSIHVPGVKEKREKMRQRSGGRGEKKGKVQMDDRNKDISQSEAGGAAREQSTL